MLASDILLELGAKILKFMTIESWGSWRRHCSRSYVKFVYDLKGALCFCNLLCSSESTWRDALPCVLYVIEGDLVFGTLIKARCFNLTALYSRKNLF